MIVSPYAVKVIRSVMEGRPSTSLPLTTTKDVGGRPKGGHDDMGRALTGRVSPNLRDRQWLACPPLENILGRQAQHHLTDRLVVQDPPLALLRDRVDIAQASFERVLLEHRHRAAVV